jgi:hypothetical protein
VKEIAVVRGTDNPGPDMVAHQKGRPPIRQLWPRSQQAATVREAGCARSAPRLGNGAHVQEVKRDVHEVLPG